MFSTTNLITVSIANTTLKFKKKMTLSFCGIRVDFFTLYRCRVKTSFSNLMVWNQTKYNHKYTPWSPYNKVAVGQSRKESNSKKDECSYLQDETCTHFFMYVTEKSRKLWVRFNLWQKPLCYLLSPSLPGCYLVSHFGPDSTTTQRMTLTLATLRLLHIETDRVNCYDKYWLDYD